MVPCYSKISYLRFGRH